MRAPWTRRWRYVRIPAYPLLIGAAGWFGTRFIYSGAHVIAVPAALVPFAVVPAVLAVVLLALGRHRIETAVAAVVALVLLAFQVPLYVGSTIPADPTISSVPAGAGNAHRFTVLTLNTKFGAADAAAIIALGVSTHADVIALEEVTRDALGRLATAGIATPFPYRQLMPFFSSNGVVLYARVPLAEVGGLREWESGSAAATVDLGRGVLQPVVLAVHVPAPWPEADGRWREQLAAIPHLLTGVPGPLVVAGDFNSTLDQDPFRRMLSDAGLTDAGDAAGAGWLRTYPSDTPLPPLVAIDHVLLRRVSAVDVHTFTVPGTDHRAVVATLAV